MISQSVELDGASFVLVRFGSPVTRPSARRPERALRPSRLVVEQGHYLAAPGLAAVEEFVALEQGARLEDPEARLVVGGQPRRWWRGGALARERVSAHIVIPGQPELHNGKVVAYRLVPQGAPVSCRPATSGCLVVKVLDLLASRWSCGGRAEPEPVVAHAVADLARELGLDQVGGYACGAPASPGDYLEAAMRTQSGDHALHHLPTCDDMSAHSEALAKLRALGFAPGPDDLWRASAFAALVAFQTMTQLVPDGVLGPSTLAALRRSAPPR